ncbi:chromatin assembly factor 1 subunit FAS1-like [Actinidia eriantha]|uniref:chromatin assembly factor 1 subunit FAS1-like n=1 Tax=Actinidia eriantha TaxID=165200 RepID=UPI0025875CFA|nr:chromatin assembly factor 1 subunit FAS1-like [Actinidia eriantha]XP_057471861.1 chromatin assembly factor 1 subunit FAS1-like [Actinidia eriantha]XP_057471862.1 chromatin assembly factor 1 subunit FAS1-like [Actinidia eriantha]
MEDPMKNPDQNNSAKKSLKRKRASMAEQLTEKERETRIIALSKELECLFKYYKEVLDEKLNLNLRECCSSNSRIACLLEESNLSLSKLVEEIYEKMKVKSGITPASVKSSVLFIGRRSVYGVPNVDADVLEDETESCLWCWETRDMKLMPKSVRGTLKVRRTCRKKMHERITAVSEMRTTLQKSETNQNLGQDLAKASQRLGKVLNEADIRLLVRSMEEKNSPNMADKEAKRGEKQLIKQLDRNKREAEKETYRLDEEHKQENWQSEKELKRLQEEAEKKERRREKEESELRKQLRKQREEAEKDQRRKEREEAELKKQLSLQKQASLMDRFLKRSKKDQSSSKAKISDSFSNKSEKVSNSVTVTMDCALSRKDDINVAELYKSYLISWRCLGLAIRSNRTQHWGIRRKPKTVVIKELKLSTNRGPAHDDELTIEKFVDEWGETKVDGRSCNTKADSSVSSSQGHYRHKQLLQFAKSYRPAFYGIWPTKSQIIGPRHPLKKDPHLDYEIDSDEEWEEEEPGESLSDCDKEDENESLGEGPLMVDDEDDSEDSFFVPDGYLSENEGVQVDRKGSDCLVEESNSSSGCKQEFESEEISVLLRQQKYLSNLTEHALRKNQPLIILNLRHEKAMLFTSEELTGIVKLEQMCLQALSMCALPGGPSLEISIDNNFQEELQDASMSESKDCTTPVTTTTAILDSDLSQIVSAIQSNSQGINKVVESLQQKFPSAPKSLLRNKVREISDFVDNRWQVKKNILDQLGLSISPEKGGGRNKSIATFFSKRCLPPADDGKMVNPTVTPPQSSRKSSAAVQLHQRYTNK